MVKHLDVRIDLGAEDGRDARVSVQATEGRLGAIRDRIRETDAGGPADDLMALVLEEAGLLLELDRKEEAWRSAKRVFDEGAREARWESAARACEVMFRAEQPLSLAALGQGIWLAVTFPVDPALTVTLLDHVVEETPDHSDGAAVAAAVAIYVVDLRATGEQHASLSVSTRQMLTAVARRHSAVQSQQDLDAWSERLDLGDVGGLLTRLRRVVDALVEEHWWIDREDIHAGLPDQ